MALGSTAVVEYLAEHGGSSEGTLSGQYAFVSNPDGKLLEAKLTLGNETFSLDPTVFYQNRAWSASDHG